MGIELDDAGAVIQGTLLEDTFNGREFPGEGILDVRRFVQAIKATGYDGPWGVEMLSTAFRKLDVDEATRRSYETAMRVLDDSTGPADARALDATADRA